MIKNIYPDVEGFLLTDALKKIEGCGFARPDIEMTSQPKVKHEGYDGNFRVLRQGMDEDGTLKLIIGKV